MVEILLKVDFNSNIKNFAKIWLEIYNQKWDQIPQSLFLNFNFEQSDGLEYWPNWF